MKRRILKYAAESYSALDRNGAHRSAADFALRIYRSDTIYSFIPKNGCSTMRLSLAIANGCIKKTEDFNWIHNNNHTFRADLEALLKAKYTFVILRSPYKRLASVYLDKIVDKTVEMWQLYDNTKRSFDTDTITFREFVNIVTAPNLLHNNIHWRPQNRFLVYEEYDDYFCLEDFSKAGKKIEKKAKIEIFDARGLTKHGTDRYREIENRCFADTPAYKIAEMKRKGKIPSHFALYDKKLFKTVKKTYAEDIVLYQQIFGRLEKPV